MRRLTAVSLATALALPWLATPALGAAGDPATGYWSRTRTGAPLPLEPPDPVPTGGTWVAQDPAGPVAISALRTDLADGLVAVELRLAIADALGTPAVQACPSIDQWAPVQGGRLEAVPLADCTSPIAARVDGEVLVVPLPAGQTSVNVVLRPAPGSAFSLTMEKATAASVVTAPAPVSPSVFSPPPPMPAPPPDASGPAFGSASGPAFLPSPSLQGPAFTPVAPTVPSPSPAPLAAPPLTRALPPVVEVAADRAPSLVAAGVLGLLLAQAAWLARQPATAPRVLGGAARRSGARPVAAVVSPSRGVGRFRTERSRPPVRL